MNEAHEKHLDVYVHASEELRVKHTEIMQANGRVVVPFEEVINGITLLCTAVGPRPRAGETAKTVRQFIREQ